MEKIEALRPFVRMSKRDMAIERIRTFCSQEKPLLAFSGGKDSQAAYHLTLEALGRERFDAAYNVSLEPPELKYFIRNAYPDVAWNRYPGFNFYTKLPEKGFPMRTRRWCCEYMKEWGGSGRVIITGLRREESQTRRHYGIVEHRGKSRLLPSPKVLINPIIDWTERDVWKYLKSLKVDYCSLYDVGATGKYRGDGVFRRLGCVLCPMETVSQKKQDILRWPKIAEAWHRAFQRLWDNRLSQGNDSCLKNWKDADDMFWWWVYEPEPIPAEQYCFAFE